MSSQGGLPLIADTCVLPGNVGTGLGPRVQVLCQLQLDRGAEMAGHLLLYLGQRTLTDPCHHRHLDMVAAVAGGTDPDLVAGDPLGAVSTADSIRAGSTWRPARVITSLTRPKTRRQRERLPHPHSSAECRRAKIG